MQVAAKTVAWVIWLYYMCYVLYIITLLSYGLIHSYFGHNEEDESQMIAAFSLGVIFILVFYGLFKWYNGESTILSTIIIWSLVAFFVMVIVAVIFYRSYMNSYGVNDKIKLATTNWIPTPATYTYGRLSTTISLEYNLNSALFNHHGHARIYDINRLLYKAMKNPEHITAAISEIFKTEVKGSVDFFCNLFWYICICSCPRIKLTRSQRKFVANLPEEELVKLLPDSYTGARDRASILFYLLTGSYIMSYDIPDRYNTVKEYAPNVVYNLAFLKYKIINDEFGTYSMVPPYVYLAQQPEAPCESIIANLHEDNIDEILDGAGIIVDGYNNNILTWDADKKITHVQGELSLYDDILTREVGLAQPPVITGLTRNSMNPILSRYTNAELSEAYEPRKRWFTRQELLDNICADVTDEPRWSLVHRFCTNDDSINVLSGDSHGDVDKDDITDPTISYGKHKDYRCYQISELEASFREYNKAFLFRRPDWVHGEPDQEFTITSIQELQKLLDDAPLTDNTIALNNKITEGLSYLSSSERRIIAIKDKYETFDATQKLLAQTYLTWMFVAAMWMRFWSGPGYAWPVKTNLLSLMKNNNRCTADERDQHVIIQESLRARIVEAYEGDPILKEWIENLPNIHYNFSDGTSTCAQYTIKQTIDDIARGKYCMGFGSDHMLKSAYFYILNVFDLQQGDEFDAFIARMLPSLLEIESEIVATELQATTNRKGTKYRVLQNRHTSLQKPISTHHGFDYWNYQNNVHVD